ncbi:hypothetical protein GF380_04000 [Candidatus Uhrbacteria bacterium]|nr:hypothetical protein [Candidatus Uhrbacteria bacterium]MBD3284253.1 hypothetical protein [Candidatus Uhrbacteria bacterium]
MQCTIINDCKDANAVGRQGSRASSLLGGSVTYVGVQNDLEAAGNLIDVLDAYDQKPGVILVNVAPRHGAAKQWPNGTPFGSFWHGETLVIASIDGLTLTLVKKLTLTTCIRVHDIPRVMERLVQDHTVDRELADRIERSQFRSFDYLPRLASWILKGIDVPYESLRIDEIPDVPKAIWFVDNFGNCKTTILPTDISFASGQSLELFGQLLTCVTQLKDVEDDQSAIIVGSSGLGSARLIEIVVQGGSAASAFSLQSGSAML